ncbi:MAG: hypothetical protein NVSMB64_13830 [Candidatus Velthaea sp.]
MKIACSSSSFAGPISAGELTQLEWLEGSASAAGLDGVVFDLAQFPRTDDEYVAQLKKVAIDLGLVPVALAAWALLDPATGEAERSAHIDLAARLGALFVMTRLPAPGGVPPAAFVAAVAAAKSAVKTAKRVNVTVLAAPAPGTLASDLAELRHFIKDVDSAWLRYAVPAEADRSAFNLRERALVAILAEGTAPEKAVDLSDEGRPWIVLTGDASPARVRALRAAAAKKTLAAASVS